MDHIVQDPRSFRPDPCEECGAEQRVSGWAYVERDSVTGFQPARVRCSERCDEKEAVGLSA